MDRSILLSNLTVPGNPELGIKVRQSRDPDSLTAQVQSAIDAAAAGGASYPYLQGCELAGGGGGDSVRAIVTLTRTVGWGLHTSIPAALARVLFRRANNAAEIETVLAQMYAAILASGGSDAFVWQPRIVGTGRDGAYVIGIVWSDGGVGSLAMNTESFAVSGPYTAATNILFLTIPQIVNANVNAEQAWLVTWGMLVEDTVGGGFRVRLEENGANVWEQVDIGAANIWRGATGHHQVIQSAVGDLGYGLWVEPIGVNALNVRGCFLRAEIANYPNSPS